MSEPLLLTGEIFAAFLKCRYKAYLKLHGAAGEKSEYEQVQARLAAEYRAAAREELLRRPEGVPVVAGPPSLPEAIRAGPALILDATASDAGESCRLDALEKVSDKEARGAGPYRPILFLRRDKVTADDRLLLAFGASILGRIQGTPPGAGRVIHGGEFKSSRVELASLSASVQEKAVQLRVLAEAPEPPPLLLNRHCPECEFRQRCRAAAVEKDDLSLLRGLSPKEIAALHVRGIFTVTQYSYTFRPGRMKGAADKPGRKHDHSLQALAVREKTIYVARRPQVPEARVRLYLDVEGLPDEDFYYLIGLHCVEGGTRRELRLWADRRADEAAIWAAFLGAVGEVGEDFVLFHYGSYESQFLDRMEARHGGDADLIARIRSRSVNVLSLIYSRVYFPVLANDLKSVAGCLGFRWSAPDASGLQAVAWRYAWEATRDEALKQQLLTYNQEDCSALREVVEMLRSLGEGWQPGDGTGLRVAGVEDAGGQNRRKFQTSKFALPEFARITKCSYFDYQRDKILFRTSPGGKKSARRKKGPRRKVWEGGRVNREVRCVTPTACSQCGSTELDRMSGYRKVVIDLKPFPGGVKRWVTAYKVRWYRCRKCRARQTPEDYRTAEKYGPGLYSWVAYASISLRQTEEAVVQSLKDLFRITLSKTSVWSLGRRAAERYRPTYEALLSALRNGSLVHADETRVRIKSADGYVWVFANPRTVVYVYAPSRDGDTLREKLAGFRGVLISDFYAAYDSLDCPQQKCLIHLVRDFNDDLLANPFDEELKQQAARFAALLQAIVETVDRYGLMKYHLHKHRKDVERFYEVESRAAYGSERAGHYQHRLLKYRDKLFTFLDHDGVPWNNNNGEHAVKAFASRRKVMGRAFAEDGIRDYLLLLSIYQTLRYRNASFWRFLLSGETDIEAFTAKGR